MLDEGQLVRWRNDLERERADQNWAITTAQWRAERTPEVLSALQGHLRAFLDGAISLPDFQSTFDKKSRVEWNIMGLKGMSAAMFLNTLVKHMPDHQAVDATLKHVLPVPPDALTAAKQMDALIDLVIGSHAAGGVTKRQVQAARCPYFLSAWWHIQDQHAWPIFYPSMRRVYERLGVWNPNHGSLTADYLAFREMTSELMNALQLDPWGIERLCAWLDGVDGKEPPTAPDLPPEPVTPIEPTSESNSVSGDGFGGSAHSRTQLILAKLGQRFGCKVWIAKNDHGKQWHGERLGDSSLTSLPPLGIGEAAQATIRLIDVIWLKGHNQVVAAFEIEHSTAIYSGLLRMSDLAVVAPNTYFPIYIVAPEDRIGKVREQLERPTFQHIELHQRCRFFSMERLIQDAPNMLEWAENPSAIDKIADRVGDVGDDAVPAADE